MKFSISYYRIFIIAIFFGLTSCSQSHKLQNNYVVVLSMDGFRWDYADRADTPNLDYIAQNGTKAEYVIPAFPSKTFSNHYTMATGLYPDNHGIVDNNFYCPDLKLRYRIGDNKAVGNPDFYLGEPIWVTAENQDVTTASYFWVGSDVNINNVLPTYSKKYNHTTSFEDRIDTVLYWLNLPEEMRPRLIMFYFDEPDSQGHTSGPDSKEIEILSNRLDSLVGVLISGIQNLPIADKVNIIVTSDHGMTATSKDTYINLLDYVDRDLIKWYQGGNPMFSIETVEGMKDSVYQILQNIDNISAWKKEEMPERFNYGKSNRIRDLIILADSGWSVGIGEARDDFYKGGHGWDNANKDMHTIFYAMGPNFKKGFIQQPFELVDLYPLLSKILGLKPAEVDGKLERVIEMLKK
jgi:predicted AlkP superfamily pyrophosphatase or phosphodiesterase